MKHCSAALEAHLKSNVTTVCTCWRVTRTDGYVMGFTDHVADVTVGGQVYLAASGYTRTAIASNSSLAVDNVDLEGILMASGITEEDCRAGVYDYAEVEVFLVNFADVSMGTLRLRRGKLGELTLKDGIFVSEIRGVVQALTRNFMDIVTPDCSVEFGSAKCGVDVSLFTEDGTVTSVLTPRRVFATDLSKPAGTYGGGVITFTSGAAQGRSMEIKSQGRLQPGAQVISEWNRTRIDVYDTRTGGPVVVNSGSDGIISIACTLILKIGTNPANPQHAWGMWRYRVQGTTSWTNTAEVKSSQPATRDSNGLITVSPTLSGLELDTLYEVEFLARRDNTGDNFAYFVGQAGISGSAVISADDGYLTLFLPLPWEIAVGDTFTVQRGCDKLWVTCKNVFDNGINFRGFKDVPGMDAIMKTPDYKEPEVG